MPNLSRSFLESQYWYHGTTQQYDTWKCPPPKKPGDEPLVAHSGLFFTSNIDFARGAGHSVARTTLSSNAKILDATANYDATEQLRTLIKDLELVSQTVNVQHDYWHQHWKTGKVLRAGFSDPFLMMHFMNQTEGLAQELDIPLHVADFIFKQNITRGFIEVICKAARSMGYDGLFGYEVDKHSGSGNEIAQPWLAIFRKEVLSSPDWLDAHKS